MSQDGIDHTTTMMSEQLIFLEALVLIIESSADPETIRIATSAITRTDSGLNYLRAHPIML